MRGRLRPQRKASARGTARAAFFLAVLIAITAVHDASGRIVRLLESGSRPMGAHVARWDGCDGRGRNAPSGVYFIHLSAGGTVSTSQLALIR